MTLERDELGAGHVVLRLVERGREDAGRGARRPGPDLVVVAPLGRAAEVAARWLPRDERPHPGVAVAGRRRAAERLAATRCRSCAGWSAARSSRRPRGTAAACRRRSGRGRSPRPRRRGSRRRSRWDRTQGTCGREAGTTSTTAASTATSAPRRRTVPALIPASRWSRTFRPAALVEDGTGGDRADGAISAPGGAPVG